MNDLKAYLPHAQCDGEDCIIIPVSQITHVEITSQSMLDCDFCIPEMTLTVVGRRKNE